MLAMEVVVILTVLLPLLSSMWPLSSIFFSWIAILELVV
jgi:hypothetical protein